MTDQALHLYFFPSFMVVTWRMASYLRAKNVALEENGDLASARDLVGSDEPHLAHKGLPTDMHRTDVSFHLPFGVKPYGVRATRVKTVEVFLAVLERDFVDVSVDALGSSDPDGLRVRMFGEIRRNGCDGLGTLGLE